MTINHIPIFSILYSGANTKGANKKNDQHNAKNDPGENQELVIILVINAVKNIVNIGKIIIYLADNFSLM